MTLERKTEFSPCRRYRYTLWREWPELFGEHLSKSYLMVIGLNPSTADETKDDPTIRRCIDFAKRWGFGALCMTNLFAWRDTDPEQMKLVEDPSGPLNDHHLLEIAKGAGMILVAWGKHGKHLNRDRRVFAMIESAHYVVMHSLKVNKDGTPQHPLYIPADTMPAIYTLPT